MEHLQNYGYPWWLVVSSPLQRYYTVNEDHHIPRITLKTEKYLWNYLRTPAWLSKGCAVLPCLTSFRQRHGTSSGKWSELGVQSNNFGHVGTKPSNLGVESFEEFHNFLAFQLNSIQNWLRIGRCSVKWETLPIPSRNPSLFWKKSQPPSKRWIMMFPIRNMVI